MPAPATATSAVAAWTAHMMFWMPSPAVAPELSVFPSRSLAHPSSGMSTIALRVSVTARRVALVSPLTSLRIDSTRPTSTRSRSASRRARTSALSPRSPASSSHASTARPIAAWPRTSPLRGRIAVANAKLAYADVFAPIIRSERWQRLHAAGANVQRPRWASTGTKSPAYSPTLYIDELTGDHTVTTVPDATLEAFRHADGPPPGATVLEGVDEARAAPGACCGGHRPRRDHRRARARRRRAVRRGISEDDRGDRPQARAGHRLLALAALRRPAAAI